MYCRPWSSRLSYTHPKWFEYSEPNGRYNQRSVKYVHGLSYSQRKDGLGLKLLLVWSSVFGVWYFLSVLEERGREKINEAFFPDVISLEDSSPTSRSTAVMYIFSCTYNSKKSCVFKYTQFLKTPRKLSLYFMIMILYISERWRRNKERKIIRLWFGISDHVNVTLWERVPSFDWWVCEGVHVCVCVCGLVWSVSVWVCMWMVPFFNCRDWILWTYEEPRTWVDNWLALFLVHFL